MDVVAYTKEMKRQIALLQARVDQVMAEDGMILAYVRSIEKTMPPYLDGFISIDGLTSLIADWEAFKATHAGDPTILDGLKELDDVATVSPPEAVPATP